MKDKLLVLDKKVPLKIRGTVAAGTLLGQAVAADTPGERVLWIGVWLVGGLVELAIQGIRNRREQRAERRAAYPEEG